MVAAPAGSRRAAWLATLLLSAFLLVTVARSFLFDVYAVSSASMAPTLFTGDRVIVSRTAYGIRVPLVRERLRTRLPQRGDVVVFSAPMPEGQEKVQVKRVVGLPGDRIELRRKALVVNGVEVPREPLEELSLDDEGLPVTRALAMADTLVAREIVSPGRSYRVLERKAVPPGDGGPWIVPQGHLFVLGDNRDASLDSRPPGGYGAVPLERVIGRVRWVVSGGGANREWWKALE